MRRDQYFGEDIWLHNLRHKPPAEGVFSLWGMNEPDVVRSLLVDPVDPKQSIREELENSTKDDPEHQTLDTIRRSFAYSHFRSKKLARSQVGTRLPWAHGDFQDHIAKMPDEQFRIRNLPFTDGKIPYAVSPLKLDVIRRLNSGLDEIPYERTGLSPKRPLAVHAAGYGVMKSKQLLKREPAMYTKWYRDNASMRAFVDSLLDDAKPRPFFDADGIEQLRAAVRDGESGAVRALSALTTVEWWLQHNYDTSKTAVAQATA